MAIGDRQIPLWWDWDKTEQEVLLFPSGVKVVPFFFSLFFSIFPGNLYSIPLLDQERCPFVPFSAGRTIET